MFRLEICFKEESNKTFSKAAFMVPERFYVVKKDNFFFPITVTSYTDNLL